MSGHPGPESLATLGLPVFVLTLGGLVSAGPLMQGASPSDVKNAEYTIAFANLGPLNTEVFLADADGGNARPVASTPEHDYNASFSRDGQWVIFTRQTLPTAIGQFRVAGESMQSPHVDAVRPTRAVWPTARPRARSDRPLEPAAV